MKISELTKEQILDYFDRNFSIRKILIDIGASSNGSGAYQTFRNRCKLLDILIERPKSFDTYFGPKKNIELNDVLMENSNYSRGLLKKRIIKEKIIEYKCTGLGCNLTDTWLGKKISLHLDHINGINNDNRIDNLRFLCPNCHSQTDTFGSKNIKFIKPVFYCECGEVRNKRYKSCGKCANIKKGFNRRKERPSLEVLENDVKELGYSGTGRKYGVSDNTIRVWIKYYKK